MDLYTLGFNNFLEQKPLFSSVPTAIKSNFSQGTAPSSLASGDTSTNLQLVDGHLQSKDFLTLVRGWIINANGDVEFNAGNFRGDITGASGSFSGIITASAIDIGGTDTTSWHVDLDGNMWWGNTGSYTAATIKISSTGVVNFTSGSFRGSLNADDITAGTLTGRTVKAKGTASAADVWIDGLDGSVKFFYGASELGFINSSTSAQILFYSSNDLYLQSLDTMFLDSGSSVDLVANSFVRLTYNDNGGTDSFLVNSNGSNKMQLDSSGNLFTAGNIQCGVTFKSSDGTSGANTTLYFVEDVYSYWTGSWTDIRERIGGFNVKDGLVTSSTGTSVYTVLAHVWNG